MAWLKLCAALSIAVALPAANDPGKAIDTRRSSLVIHVGKAGLFSAAGHEHWVEAPIVSGSVNDDVTSASVQLGVKAAQLTVRPDKGLSARQTAEVQSNMQNEVLESSQYPDILFQSTGIEKKSGVWAVTGNLALHGVTKRVLVTVRRDDGVYSGTTNIKQTDFGIHPIRVGGGAVKVKDELEISFKIYLLSSH